MLGKEIVEGRKGGGNGEYGDGEGEEGWWGLDCGRKERGGKRRIWGGGKGLGMLGKVTEVG